MSPRLGRMERLTRLAAADERRARQAVGAVVQEGERARARQRELERYRREYAASSPDGNASSALLWQDRQVFLSRLDAAIEAQRQLIREHEIKLDVERQRWLAKRQRLQSLEKAVGRVRDVERYAAERREQKTADEIAATAGTRLTLD